MALDHKFADKCSHVRACIHKSADLCAHISKFTRSCTHGMQTRRHYWRNLQAFTCAHVRAQMCAWQVHARVQAQVSVYSFLLAFRFACHVCMRVHVHVCARKCRIRDQICVRVPRLHKCACAHLCACWCLCVMCACVCAGARVCVCVCVCVCNVRIYARCTLARVMHAGFRGHTCTCARACRHDTHAQICLQMHACARTHAPFTHTRMRADT